jgi:hypothetical protein
MTYHCLRHEVRKTLLLLFVFFAKCVGHVSLIIGVITLTYNTNSHFYLPMPCTNSTMFRAPTNMRRVDVQAYDPVLVSIGPFHYKKPQLQEMEEHKIRFLFGLMRYQRKEEREVRLQRLAEAMKRLEGRPRWCYSDTLL